MSDLVPPELYDSQERKANKEHKCCECITLIKKGERYHSIKGKWDGEFSIHKVCKPCFALFEASQNDDGPYFTGLSYHLQNIQTGDHEYVELDQRAVWDFWYRAGGVWKIHTWEEQMKAVRAMNPCADVPPIYKARFSEPVWSDCIDFIKLNGDLYRISTLHPGHRYLVIDKVLKLLDDPKEIANSSELRCPYCLSIWDDAFESGQYGELECDECLGEFEFCLTQRFLYDGDIYIYYSSKPKTAPSFTVAFAKLE